MDNLYSLLAGLLMPGLLIYLYFKRRNKRLREVSSVNPPGIDHEALDQATEAVKSMDLRAELYKNHTPIKDYYSLHGHNAGSMTAIIVKLKQAGISADYYFARSLPVGVMSYMTETGTYQLFVDKDKVDEAKAILASLK